MNEREAGIILIIIGILGMANHIDWSGLVLLIGILLVL